MVNICNCDHVTFRSTPVIEELALADHGLRYIDSSRRRSHIAWEVARRGVYRDVGRTLDAARPHVSREVDGFGVIRGGVQPPARPRQGQRPADAARCRRVRGRASRAWCATLLRWSRRSAARDAPLLHDEALRGPAMAAGPMVWGLSPEQPGTDSARPTYAMRHLNGVARPVGGSGAMTEALRAAVESHGGAVRTSSVVTAVLCGRNGVRGSASPTGPRSPRRSWCRRATRAHVRRVARAGTEPGGGDHRPLATGTAPRGLRVEGRRRRRRRAAYRATSTTTSARR